MKLGFKNGVTKKSQKWSNESRTADSCEMT